MNKGANNNRNRLENGPAEKVLRRIVELERETPIRVRREANVTKESPLSFITRYSVGVCSKLHPCQ